MSLLSRRWERISGSQPLPPAWVVAVTGLAALLLVLNTGSWRLAGKVITIAHEGGHALVSVLSGRRLEGIRLHSDSSGVTYSRGKRRGPGLVLTAAAGYLTPSLLGAGAAGLLAARHQTALLWLALILLAATFLAIRNAFGALAVLATAGCVFAVSYFASAAAQAGFAYLFAWFLLLGADAPGARAGQPPPPAPRGVRRRPARPAYRRPARRVGHRVPPGLRRRPGPGHPPAHPVTPRAEYGARHDHETRRWPGMITGRSAGSARAFTYFAIIARNLVHKLTMFTPPFYHLLIFIF